MRRSSVTAGCAIMDICATESETWAGAGICERRVKRGVSKVDLMDHETDQLAFHRAFDELYPLLGGFIISIFTYEHIEGSRNLITHWYPDVAMDFCTMWKIEDGQLCERECSGKKGPRAVRSAYASKKMEDLAVHRWLGMGW